MANKTMHHVVIGDDTFEVIDEAGREETTALKEDLIPFPTGTDSKYGQNGQLLRTKGNGTTEWVDEGLPTDKQTADAVRSWLDEHPEATTTVQDGSIVKQKLVYELGTAFLNTSSIAQENYIASLYYDINLQSEDEDYSQVQGSCVLGGFVYMCFIKYNNADAKAVIRKLNLLTNVIEESLPLDLYHANDMTTDGSYLYIAPASGNRSVIKIDPSTLTILEIISVPMPSGASLSAIAYNSGLWYVADSQSGNIYQTSSLTDLSDAYVFNPFNGKTQGIFSIDENTIADVESFPSCLNVYDIKLGKIIRSYLLSNNKEYESATYVDGKIIAVSASRPTTSPTYQRTVLHEISLERDLRVNAYYSFTETVRKTIYVNSNYTGLYEDGSSTYPYKQIASALTDNEYIDGGIIQVLEGNYKEFVLNGKDVQIRCAGNVVFNGVFVLNGKLSIINAGSGSVILNNFYTGVNALYVDSGNIYANITSFANINIANGSDVKLYGNATDEILVSNSKLVTAISNIPSVKASANSEIVARGNGNVSSIGAAGSGVNVGVKVRNSVSALPFTTVESTGFYYIDLVIGRSVFTFVASSGWDAFVYSSYNVLYAVTFEVTSANKKLTINKPSKVWATDLTTGTTSDVTSTWANAITAYILHN